MHTRTHEQPHAGTHEHRRIHTHTHAPSRIPAYTRTRSRARAHAPALGWGGCMGTLWVLYGYSMGTLWVLKGYSGGTRARAHAPALGWGGCSSGRAESNHKTTKTRGVTAGAGEKSTKGKQTHLKPDEGIYIWATDIIDVYIQTGGYVSLDLLRCRRTGAQQQRYQYVGVMHGVLVWGTRSTLPTPS